MIYKKCDLII